MTAAHPVPPELAEAAAAFATAWSEQQRGYLAELADALGTAVKVAAAPSDSCNWATYDLATTNPVALVPYQLDRTRVTILNTGSVPLRLGKGPDLLTSASLGVALPAGASITIDTRAAIFAVAISAQGQAGVITEQYDR